MQQKTTFSLFLLYVCLISYSNTTTAQSLNRVSHKLGLSLNLGTTPGIDVGYALSAKVTARLGYSYFKYNTSTVSKTSGEEVKLGSDANVSIASFSFEYYPFKKSSFKLIGGASYFDKGQTALVVTPTGTYKFGSTTFTPEEVGNVQFTVDYGKQYAPFAGIGFGRTIPKRRVGFGFEVGSYYTQTPKVTFTGDRRLNSMSEQQAKVQENMKDWKYWPVVNLRLAIRLD